MDFTLGRGLTGRNRVYFILIVLCSNIRRVTHCTIIKERAKSSFECTAKYLTHNRPSAHTAVHYRAPTLSTIPPVTTRLTPLGPL